MFANRDNKKLLALKVVAVREQLVRDTCDGWPCAKKLLPHTETVWTYGCITGQKPPPRDIYPPTLQQLRD